MKLTKLDNETKANILNMLIDMLVDGDDRIQLRGIKYEDALWGWALNINGEPTFNDAGMFLAEWDKPND